MYYKKQKQKQNNNMCIAINTLGYMATLQKAWLTQAF